jgi:hypothetical protein
MSGCALRRWGPGTTKERTPDTESARQLESSLKSLLASRASLDTQFSAAAAATTTVAATTQTPSMYITESSVIDTRTVQKSDKNDTYRSDILLNTGDGSKPQVQARTQLTSSMNWGAF